MNRKNLFGYFFTGFLAIFMTTICFLFIRANYLIAGEIAFVTFVFGGFFFIMIKSLINEFLDKGMEIKNIKTSYGNFPTILHLEKYLKEKYANSQKSEVEK